MDDPKEDFHAPSQHATGPASGTGVENTGLFYEPKEEHTLGFTPERKYLHVGDMFIKRTLRDWELPESAIDGEISMPRQARDRILNEAATMLFIKEFSNIPVPRPIAVFDDDGAVCLFMEFIEGVGMDELTEEQREVVRQELDIHLNTLRNLRSRKIGGPRGIVIPPYRVRRRSSCDDWKLEPSESEDLIFCHNDLVQSNIIVDPESMKIRAIVDWECAGFYPAFFERRFFERRGPAFALDGEDDDTEKLIDFLDSRQMTKSLDGSEEAEEAEEAEDLEDSEDSDEWEKADEE
ncbi:MAG: hypothetical protein M1832_003790 [Thelocarpon impressellum]|nr:MAG: hypothetical protein M1832_003790 [Thelocarpon impressellum]